MKKHSFYLLFFRSTLIISIATSVAITFVATAYSSEAVQGGSHIVLSVIESFLKVWCIGGLASSVLYKEVVKKDEYYFYYNAGISKIRLIGTTFVLYVSFSLIIYYLCLLIVNNI